MKYRSDISGLRALAVVPVVVFHFNEAWLPGGFVGVDIFFVISGYLITAILAGDLAQGRFSLLRFYDRRLRRIVPAFAAVALVTALVSLFILPPVLLSGFGASLRAASIFFANRYFLSVTHYFGAAPDEVVLLHTGSLSVEEQFYLGWPLLLAALFHPRLKRWLPHIVGTLILVSLFVATRNAVQRPVTAFYNSNGRFWELMLGAWLALGYVPRLNRIWAEVAAAVGLALIVAALVLFQPSRIIFPGLSALVPTLGAALLLWSGEEGRRTLVGRILSFAPIAGIGLISYSLYLWHWPIIAIHRYLTFRAPTPLECVLLFAVMIAVSAFSWRFIENPFRHTVRVPTRRMEWRGVATGVAMLALLVGIGTLFTATGGLPARATAGFLKSEAIVNTFWRGREACLLGRTSDRERDCRFGASAPDAPLFVLWGDSQADQHGPGLDQVAREMGMSFLQLTRTGCAPLAPETGGGALQSRETIDCNAFRAEALKRIIEDPKVRFAVIAGRWTNEPALGPAMARLKAAVDQITAAGKPVLLAAPIGAFANGGGRCIVRRGFMGLDDAMCGLSRITSDAQAQPTEDALRAIAANAPGVTLFVPRPLFCDETACHPRKDDVPLYFDGDHLNVEGSLFLAPAWRSALEKAAAAVSRPGS